MEEEEEEDVDDANPPADPESDNEGGWVGPVRTDVSDKFPMVLVVPNIFLIRPVLLLFARTGYDMLERGFSVLSSDDRFSKEL